MDFAIIAAGEGSRLVQEGVKSPKPLVRLHGVTLVDRLLDVFFKNKASSVSIIVNEEMTEVQNHLEGMKTEVPFNLLVKSTPGSMHSFHALSRFFTGEKLCLTTVDTIFQEDEFSRYIEAFREDTMYDGFMAVTDYIEDEKPLYVEVDEDFSIRGFHDDREAGCRYVSGGIYCLKRNAIQVLEKAIASGTLRMRDYQRQLIQEGLRLKAFPFTKIIDVDHAEDINKAEQFLKTN